MPGVAIQLTWSYQFSVNPASITVQLQASFDNNTFFVVDTSSLVGGDARTVYTSAPWVRLAITASSGGTAITAFLLAKAAPVTTFASPALTSSSLRFPLGTALTETALNFLSLSGALFTGSSIRIPIGSSYYWEAGSVLSCLSDGNVRLSNQATNGFGLLQFGGTTAAYPALKRVSGGLEIKLADDSQFASLNVARYDVSSSWGIGLSGGEMYIGDPGLNTRIRTNLATPSSLANNEWWVECTGVSPARICAIKVRDGGATRTIGSVTY